MANRPGIRSASIAHLEAPFVATHWMIAWSSAHVHDPRMMFGSTTLRQCERTCLLVLFGKCVAISSQSSVFETRDDKSESSSGVHWVLLAFRVRFLFRVGARGIDPGISSMS
ncbi:hypothetical protein TRFO_25175 [Tritrichomonas foetus]|uniref:Uncharacterized protein n=1 Tax=Tritrichomonas foetus TaxID=1144522 RepID=A0A1J4K5I2_9EUKA|nr:hypothetical protein TRFO_25175 [Tritrichomonas foetus]|eukprot:OHT06713.1 hypothetical protein TRFO_25175 [Tritrichomonas foetus]